MTNTAIIRKPIHNTFINTWKDLSEVLSRPGALKVKASDDPSKRLMHKYDTGDKSTQGIEVPKSFIEKLMGFFQRVSEGKEVSVTIPDNPIKGTSTLSNILSLLYAYTSQSSTSKNADQLLDKIKRMVKGEEMIQQLIDEIDDARESGVIPEHHFIAFKENYYPGITNPKNLNKPEMDEYYVRMLGVLNGLKES